MKHLGTPENLLQMKVEVQPDCIKLSQIKHIEKSMERFGLAKADCSKATTPMEEGDKTLKRAEQPDTTLPYREIIGALLWVSRCTRPDISHAVAYLGQFSCHYDQTHFKAAKRVLKYLWLTRDSVLTFRKPHQYQRPEIVVCCDSDWAAGRQDRKSMTGSITFLNGMPVNWISKKQTTVALSSTEAEVYAMSVACTDALHLWSFMQPLSPPSLPIKIFCDNQGAKCIAEQGSNSVRSKWYDTRVLFLRDWFKTKALRFHYLNTRFNVSDAFTKSLGQVKLDVFRPQMLGINPVDYQSAVMVRPD